MVLKDVDLNELERRLNVLSCIAHDLILKSKEWWLRHSFFRGKVSKDVLDGICTRNAIEFPIIDISNVREVLSRYGINVYSSQFTSSYANVEERSIYLRRCDVFEILHECTHILFHDMLSSVSTMDGECIVDAITLIAYVKGARLAYPEKTFIACVKRRLRPKLNFFLTMIKCSEWKKVLLKYWLKA